MLTSFVRQREPPADEETSCPSFRHAPISTQLRHQAKDLLRQPAPVTAMPRLDCRAVSERPVLATAQLVVAREYGFTSWLALKAEVERREILETST